MPGGWHREPTISSRSAKSQALFNTLGYRLQRFTLDSDPMHDAPVPIAIIQGAMERCAVVPEGHVAQPPAMTVGELRLSCMVAQELEQGLGLADRPSVDALGETTIHTEDLPARDRMTNDNRMEGAAACLVRQAF